MPSGPAPGYHTPAMTEEVLRELNPGGAGLWLDCTVGGGGHARLICERLSEDAAFVGIDRDPLALAAAEEALRGLPCRVLLERALFSQAAEVVDRIGLPVSGALWDLGVSSAQIDRGTGFSFRDLDAELDLRQDPDQLERAADIANDTPERALADLIFQNSDERFARRIAAGIVRRRPLRTVGDLVRAVDASLPKGWRTRDDVIRRVMQAFRIAVNHEFDELRESLESIAPRLLPGARMVVLSYHSGEDRIVKHFFRQGKQDGMLSILTSRPLRPSQEESRANPRARPARLRAAEKSA